MGLVVQGVSINGHKLHEIQMPITSHCIGVTAYLSYPKHRIIININENKATLSAPAFLVLEMYRRAILPQDSNVPISLEISGKKVGQYTVVDFRYPDSGATAPVTIVLRRVVKAETT